MLFYGCRHCAFRVIIMVSSIIKHDKQGQYRLRFLNCYFNYGPDKETGDYVQPFLMGEFPGEGDNFIGALYYVRIRKEDDDRDIETMMQTKTKTNSSYNKFPEIERCIQSVKGKFRLRAFLATMGFNTIMSVCMSVIIVCSYTIVSHIR